MEWVVSLGLVVGGVLPARWDGEEDEELRLPSELELSFPDVDDRRESDDLDFDREWWLTPA